jgi:hypothetical protein
MPTYEFSFPGSAAGLPVSITQGGVQVDTATAGSPSSPWGPVVVSADLPEGSYVAEAYNLSTFYSSRATGVVNVLASVASDVSDPESDIGAALSATFVAGQIEDAEGTPVAGQRLRVVLDAFGEIDDLIVEEN